MSDAEARERRRNRLLLSKEDRMSKILSSTGSSSENAATQDDHENAKTSTTSKSVTKSAAHKSPSKVKNPIAPLNPTKIHVQPSDITSQVTTSKSSNLAHLLVIIASSLAISVLRLLSAQNCASLPKYFCDFFKDNTYSLMLSSFCLIEAAEFLFGRLANKKGGVLDVSILLKDFCLFLFCILLVLKLTD